MGYAATALIPLAAALLLLAIPGPTTASCKGLHQEDTQSQPQLADLLLSGLFQSAGSQKPLDSSSDGSWEAGRSQGLFTTRDTPFDPQAADYAPRFVSSTPPARVDIPFGQEAAAQQEAVVQEVLTSHHLLTAATVSSAGPLNGALQGALSLLAEASKAATQLELDLDFAEGGAHATAAQGSAGTLFVEHTAGGLEAQLEVDFSASREEVTSLMQTISDLATGQTERFFQRQSNSEVLQGVEELMHAVSTRVHDIMRQNGQVLIALQGAAAGAAWESAEAQSAAGASKASIGGRRGLNPGREEALSIVFNASGADVPDRQMCTMHIIGGLLLAAAVVFAVVALLVPRSQHDEEVNNDLVPAGAIVCAADEKVPGFPAHQGIPYTPLAAQSEHKSEMA